MQRNAWSRIHTTNSLAGMAQQVVTGTTRVRTGCTAPGCGPDPVHGGSLNPTCAVCKGNGYTWTLRRSHFPARIMWISGGVPDFVSRFSMFMGEDVGDLVLAVPQLHESALMNFVNNTDGWLTIDHKRVKVAGMTRNRVDGESTVLVMCNLFKPDETK